MYRSPFQIIDKGVNSYLLSPPPDGMGVEMDQAMRVRCEYEGRIPDDEVGILPFVDNLYFPRSGVIMVQDVWTLRRAAGGDDRASKGINHWSDLTFIEWWNHAATPAQRGGLQFVIVSNLNNERTKAVIFEVLKASGYQLKQLPYPGRTYSTETEAGKAILGSMNGCGVGFLLAQHKADLGHKEVVSVQVFDTNLSSGPYNHHPELRHMTMVLKIEDVK